MKPKTALVTGATGFIGHHLCRRLRQLGLRVTGVSRSRHESNDCGTWVRCDLRKTEQVDDMMAKVRPDYLFHLASHVAGARDITLVRQTFDDNLLSTINLLVAAEKTGCQKIVLTGSLEEPQPDMSWPVPSSPYAAAKFAASAYGRMFHALYHLPVITLRLFMVYGPEQRDLKKLIPYTILSLKENKSPQFSSGDRAVDWVFVDDVVDAFIRCLDTDQAHGATIDIGSGTLATVREVVEMISSLMASNLELNFGAVSERKNEQVRKADNSLALNLLNWQPKTSLEDGLSATINSFQIDSVRNQVL